MNEIVKHKLYEFFSDGEQLSAMRLLLITWGIGVFIVWSIVSIHSMTLVSLPPSLIAYLGSLVGGKLIQNVTEGKNNI